MQSNEKSVSEFMRWCNEQLHDSTADGDESIVKKALGQIGYNIKSIYEEKDLAQLRSMLCNLVTKRKQCGINNSEDYISAIMLLTRYIEYREKSQLRSEGTTQRDKTIDSLTFAYYLSRMNEKALEELNCKNFTVAFKKVATLLGQKISTIKNMRDEFDPYFENGRKGWYQRELRGTRKEVYEKYKDTSDKALAEEIKKLIKLYSPDNQSENETSHARIKLSKKGMKEINYKKK